MISALASLVDIEPAIDGVWAHIGVTKIEQDGLTGLLRYAFSLLEHGGGVEVLVTRLVWVTLGCKGQGLAR